MPIQPLPPGLTTEIARTRLAEAGSNAMADTTPPAWLRALATFWTPVPWMLEAAIVLQLLIGEYPEAAVIGVLLIFNAMLGFVQESRAQATLDALKARLALNASVRRDGVWSTILATELVPGDLIKLSLGGIVGADVRLISGNVLLDHSMLTGESLPVEAGPGGETYAGALVRRGEAVAEVVATGPRTKFGRTAELVRTASVVGSQQKAVMRVVRNLAMFNLAALVVQVTIAQWLHLPIGEIVPLAVTALLAAIPVALPAAFTLSNAMAARNLAANGVLPTRLSAIDEAAAMDVLCADKTGTLTQNELAVTAVRMANGLDADRVLALAARASSDGGQDPVDAAIRQAAKAVADGLQLVSFIPFDPAKKRSEAVTTDAAGQALRIVKGAYATVSALTPPDPTLAAAADDLQAQGFRVLAVAAGPGEAMTLAGLVALSDPPRADSADLIAQLASLGVHTVMVTGDAPATAGVVAASIGLHGAVCPPGPPPGAVRPDQFAVFAGVLPEEKFNIVKTFQNAGHIVGMCGDGANDAPALRQAQMGIAVFSATDVAKSAAGLVLMEPGLAGILAAVYQGRRTFQRILTYTLRSVTRKIDQLLFLTFGLVLTGHAILTPQLMVILMLTGDLLAMTSSTDRVTPSTTPNTWRIDHVTLAGGIFGLCNLVFCGAVITIGKLVIGLDTEAVRTLAAIVLVFSGQAVLYTMRERRRMWRSRPSGWLMASSVVDILIIGTLAATGTLMAALPVSVVIGTLLAACGFALILDTVKVIVLRRLSIQ